MLDAAEVTDLQAELAEARGEIARYKQALRAIRFLCDAPHWTAKRRWTIRDRCNTELGTPHGE